MTKPEHTKSSEIGAITTNITELQNNPILVPISDYQKGSVMYEKEDERESTNLTKRKEALTKLQDTGIFDDSAISIRYRDVVEIWERIAWIYQKNVILANQSIAQIRKVVEKFYITKAESDKRINELREELKLIKADKSKTGTKKIEDDNKVLEETDNAS